MTCGRDNAVRVVDLRAFEPRATLRAPGFAVGAVWTNACLGPDERHAAAGERGRGYIVGFRGEAGPDAEKSAVCINACLGPDGLLAAACAPELLVLSTSLTLSRVDSRHICGE